LNTFYKTFVFRVSTDGQYTFSIQPTGFQAASYLYQGIFDPTNPLLKLYAIGSSTLTSTLVSGSGTWYLVVTSQAAGGTGPYGLTVTAGPVFVTKTPAPTITTQPASINIFRNQT